MSKEHRVSIITVNSEYAERLLGSQVKNRAITNKKVSFYKDSMDKGEWRGGCSMLCVDWNGHLIDGQHRLKSIILSGVTTTFVLSEGHDPMDYPVFDTNKPRNASDALSLESVPNSRAYSAALRVLAEYVSTHYIGIRVRNDTISPTSALIEHKKHAKLHDSINYVGNLLKGGDRIVEHSLAAFCHYAFSIVDTELSNGFFISFLRGEGLVFNEPIWQLRRILLKYKSVKGRLVIQDKLIYIIKTWNMVNGTGARERLVLKTTEGIPVIYGEPFKDMYSEKVRFGITNQ